MTLEQYATAKGLPIEFLQRLGLTTVYLSGMPVVSTPFKDAEGVVKAVQFRRSMDKGDHEDGRFFWSRKGTKPLLYGLWRTEAFTQAQTIVLTEGASDCQTLWLHDVAALGLPGADSWREEWATALDSFERIYIIREPDAGGEAVEKWVAQSSIRHRVWFIHLDTFKDPSGLYLAAPTEFRDKWTYAVSHATSWADAYHARLLKDVTRLYGTIRPLLEAPDLLDQLRAAIHDMGYVGDTWAPVLVYLMLTSRLLDRPMNGAVIGPASVGKNVAVDIAQEFLPTAEFHAFEASSPLALIYDDADLRHKAVLVGELDSLADEGPAGSAIRSLAQNNQTTYDVVEKDSKSGKFRTRRICRDGPTLLLTTGTKSPAPQLQTRMLELHLQDDPELTHQILERQSQERGLETLKKPDLQPWKDLQAWLALQVTRVRIPFATAIAKALHARVKRPPTRLRRDYPKLLTCIEAITLLYQCQRTWTSHGEVLATLDDYEAARALLERVFGNIVYDGVTAAVRQTVAGVATLSEAPPSDAKGVSETALAKHLSLSKTAIQYRVKQCLAGGWLINHEERKGRAAQLVLGAPLPDDGPILPTVEEVERYWHPPPPDPDSVPSVDSPVTNAIPMENRDERDLHGEAPSVGQSVTDAIPTENAPQAVSTLSNRPGEHLLGQSIVHQVNHAVSTENGDRPSELVGSPDIPSPLPPTGEPVETSVDVGVSYEAPPYTYIQDASQLTAVLPEILKARTIGLDVETTGLNPLSDRLRLVQLATPDHVYVIDAYTCNIQPLAPVMGGDRWLIGHHLKFDLAMLAQAGLPWPTAKLLDTMLAAQVLGAGKAGMVKGVYSLEALADTYLSRVLDKALQRSDWGQPTLSREQVRYAVIDADVPLALAKALGKLLHEDRLWETAKLESACAAAFAAMELAGMPIDVAAWEALAAQQAQRAEALRAELNALAGRAINWNSWQQVLAVLQARGVSAEQTNEDALIPYAADAVVARLLAYRQAAKAAGTYGLSWLDHVDATTGRIHSDFLQLGTGVGRSSCRGPNVQNLPRGKAYRHAFRAVDGRCLVKADYSQLHLRIVSVRAPDEAMQQAFQQGIDLHTKTAGDLRGRAGDEVTKDDRQLAKALNFGLIYGMGVPRLQKQAWKDYGVRMTEEEAATHRQVWFRLYPGVRRWHDREQYAIAHDHITETRSYLGRRRTGITYLPDRLSSPILGTEADGMKAAMVALLADQAAFPTAAVVNCIHDELLVECDRREADEVKAWVTGHMERAMQAAVREKTRTPVDAHEGQSWAGE